MLEQEIVIITLYIFSIYVLDFPSNDLHETPADVLQMYS